MPILHLTLHRTWFDLIASGNKTMEYRQDTAYWHKRIFNDDGWNRRFDEIHFRNGYGKHRPLMVTEFLFAMVTHSNLCSCANGEALQGRVIVIAIGDKIRFENYHVDKQRICGGCGVLIGGAASLCPECDRALSESRLSWTDEIQEES